MILPKIGITLGDPGGIGPEIIIKAFASGSSLPQAKYILFGSRLVMEKEKQALGLDLKIPTINSAEKQPESLLSLFEVEHSLTTLKKGVPSKANGLASFLFFADAVKQAKREKIQALVTAPISKHSWNLAGIKWPGHTGFLSHFYPQAIMSFWSEKIRVVLFTHHLPLREALKKIKKKAFLSFLLLLNDVIEKIHPKKYQFLVAGLNPHAGEQGLLGSEEEQEIIPAVEGAKKKGMSISGPFPPDVIFRKALSQPDKIVIALYHDQGLIPFKLEAFHKGVNVTLGLPFIRTSPDHGTAFDIAGKGIADPQSMVKAIEHAFDLSPLF